MSATPAPVRESATTQRDRTFEQADLYAHLDTRDMAEDIKVIQKAGK